jgi:hypothetical protein
VTRERTFDDNHLTLNTIARVHSPGMRGGHSSQQCCPQRAGGTPGYARQIRTAPQAKSRGARQARISTRACLERRVQPASAGFSGSRIHLLAIFLLSFREGQCASFGRVREPANRRYLRAGVTSMAGSSVVAAIAGAGAP